MLVVEVVVFVFGVEEGELVFAGCVELGEEFGVAGASFALSLLLLLMLLLLLLLLTEAGDLSTHSLWCAVLVSLMLLLVFPLPLIRSEMMELLLTSQPPGDVGGDVEVGEAEADEELATELQLPVLRDRSVGSFSLAAADAWWWWKLASWWWWALKGFA